MEMDIIASYQVFKCWKLLSRQLNVINVSKCIQAYLGYYVASKLRGFFTPGPIHRISSRDGCYLAMGCLPLDILF
jgi:hypothetical protein